MSDKPKCYGEYESKNEICEKCKFVDPCEIETMKSKKKPKEKSKTSKEEDNFLDDIYRAATEDTVTRLYRLRKEAMKDGDIAMVKLLSAELINAVRAKVEGGGSKMSDMEKALYDASIKRLTDDPVEKTLKLMDRFADRAGKSDTEAITGAIESSVKEVSGTFKEVLGRKKLGKVLEDDKYANEWTKCGVCGQMINHPDPKSCPSCGATGETPTGTEDEIINAPVNDADIDCFGTYDESDEECKNCPKDKECMAQKPKEVTTNFKKVSSEPLSEDADDFLDEIHRLCEWIEDGVNAKTNTTTLYKLGVGNRIQRGRKPKQKHLDKVKASLLTSEIGMDTLLEIAAQFSGHPEAQEYEIDEMIKVLSSKKGQGFVHNSWSTLKALAEQDGIKLTDKDRESMIEKMNEYSDIKLIPENYFKESPESEEEPEPEPEKPAIKKPGKKKSTKKKTKSQKKKIEAKKKQIADTTMTECPLCHEEMTISELKGHIAKCKV